MKKKIVYFLVVVALLFNVMGVVPVKAFSDGSPNARKSDQFGTSRTTNTKPSHSFTTTYNFNLPDGPLYYNFDSGESEVRIDFYDVAGHSLGNVRYHFSIADTEKQNGKGMQETVLIHAQMSSTEVKVGKKYRFAVFESNEVKQSLNYNQEGFKSPDDYRFLNTVPERKELDSSSTYSSDFGLGLSGGGGSQGWSLQGSLSVSLGYSSTLTQHAVEPKNYSNQTTADIIYKYSNYHGIGWAVSKQEARRAFNKKNTETHNSSFAFVAETPYDTNEVRIALFAAARVVETKSSLKQWNGAIADVSNKDDASGLMRSSYCVFLQKWYNPKGGK